MESNWALVVPPGANKAKLRGLQVSFFQRCKWPRGKMLGGTGGLNYMLYVRGNKDDFDDWATLGNRGWSYEEVGDILK